MVQQLGIMLCKEREKMGEIQKNVAKGIINISGIRADLSYAKSPILMHPAFAAHILGTVGKCMIPVIISL